MTEAIIIFTAGVLVTGATSYYAASLASERRMSTVETKVDLGFENLAAQIKTSGEVLGKQVETVRNELLTKIGDVKDETRTYYQRRAGG